MNQPLRVKKGKQGGLYWVKVESQSGFVNRISSRGTESQSHTPRVSVKKQKTPLKLKVDEKQQQNNKKQPTKQKSYKSINKTFYDYQSSCQTRATPTVTFTTKCNSCQAHQQQYNQLSSTLRKYQHDQRQLKSKLDELKQQYQKSLRKYKVKSKIQKDELKLLKWILSERKEFHLILEQLQEMKRTGVRVFEQCDDREKENLNENVCITDRSVIEKQKSKDISVEPKSQQPKKTQTKLIQTSQQLEQSKTSSTSRQIQMFNHINVLQQKVMELTVKNDFLQRLKIKQQHPYTNNINYVHHHMNNANQSKLGYYHHHHKRYIDNDKSDDEIVDELSFDRQLFDGGSMNNNCQSLLMNSLDKRQIREEVESRYVSPFKERGGDNVSRRQHYRDFHKREQSVINDVVALPESRSRYYDSIKQRSRLLEL